MMKQIFKLSLFLLCSGIISEKSLSQTLDLAVPQLSGTSQTQLNIANKMKRAVPVQVYFFFQNQLLPQESQLIVDAFSSTSLALPLNTRIVRLRSPSLGYISMTATSPEFKTPIQGRAHTSGSSTVSLSNLNLSATALLLTSASFQPHDAEVVFKNAVGEVLKVAKFRFTNAFQQTRVPLRNLFLPASTTQAEIHSSFQHLTGVIDLDVEGRFVSYTQGTSEIHKNKVATPNTFAFSHFSNKIVSDSFLLATTSVPWITFLDAWKNQKVPSRKAVIAKVKASTVATNWNWQSPNQSPWSWEVSEVISINDLSYSDCVTTPEELELFWGLWKDQAQVCFWNYVPRN